MSLKKNNNKFVLILITIVLVFNTFSVIRIYFIFDKRTNNLGSGIVQLIQQLGDSEGSNAKIKLELPDSGYETLGYKGAPIQMDLITDIECPHCEKLYEMLFPKIEDTYIKMGLVQLRYHAFPLENIHPKAMPIAKKLYYENKDGDFWKSYKYYSENIKDLNVADLTFNDAMSELEAEKEIRLNMQKLKEIGIKGTPAIIINDYQLSPINSYENIKSNIDELLKNLSTGISASLVEKLVNEEGFQLIDVRTSDEFANGSIKNAINIDVMQYESFLKDLKNLDKTKAYIVYCKSGTRSSWAWNIMQSEGFDNVLNLKIGYDGWIKDPK